jgi:hypothetical protein
MGLCPYRCGPRVVSNSFAHLLLQALTRTAQRFQIRWAHARLAFFLFSQEAYTRPAQMQARRMHW